MSIIPPGPETGVSLYYSSSSNNLICCIVSEHSHQWYALDLDSWGNPDVFITQNNSWGVDEDVGGSVGLEIDDYSPDNLIFNRAERNIERIR
jgi:hypothetical protein